MEIRGNYLFLLVQLLSCINADTYVCVCVCICVWDYCARSFSEAFLSIVAI